MRARVFIISTALVVANAALWLIFRHGEGSPPTPTVAVPTAPAAMVPPFPHPAPRRAGPDASATGELPDTPSVARKLATLESRRHQLTDPTRRAKNLETARARIERSKGALFQRLENLPPEKSAALREILAEGDLRMSVAALPLVSPDGNLDTSPVSAAMDRARQETEQQVAGLLEADALNEYLAYQKSEPYRGTLDQITSVMRTRGIKVSSELQEKLLDGYAEAMAAATREAVLDPGDRLAGGTSVPALRDRQLARVDTQLATTMARLLDPEAYKIFMDAEFARSDGAP